MSRPSRRPLPATASSAPWGWTLVGLLLGALGALTLWAPARWLAAPLAAATGGQVRLLDAQGSVWQGSARLRLSAGGDAPGAQELPTRLNWRLAPTGTGMTVSVQTDCCIPQSWRWQVGLGWGSWTLRAADLRSHWRAEWLAALGTPWNTVQLRGPISVDTAGWALQGAQGRVHTEGSVQVQLADAASRLSTLPRLGTYALRLQGGAAPTLTLSTLDGALQLDGQGRWVGGRLRFNGEARTDAAHADALANLLAILGRRKGDRALIQIG